jgi:anti-anti-sigma regulatory factor
MLWPAYSRRRSIADSMAAAVQCVLKVAPTASGCVIRVEGQGTMYRSPAARDIAIRALDGGATVVIDLSACTYLDSTFLGCLMELFRRYGKSQPPRYFLHGSTEALKRVLGPTHIDRLIPALPEAPALCGEWVEARAPTMEKREHLLHLLDCHRALASVDSPMKGAFARIVEQIEKELEK